MQIDCYGNAHNTASFEAVSAFESLVYNILSHGPSGGDALARSLAADPDLVSSHAVRGFANVILAREELIPAAAQAHMVAMATLDLRGGTATEHALTEALGLAVEGKLIKAASRLEAHLDTRPKEILSAKLAHAFRFMSGDSLGMMLTTARIVDAWSPDDAGFGFLLGCHAFGLEESGQYCAAERIGRRAVSLEPNDSWGLHAVSHVHEMEGRTHEGIAWLEEHRPTWSVCNNFSFHMAWHLALFHLELGDVEHALSIYDQWVRPVSTDDFRDVANAVSMLWRLRQERIDVGDRWEELRCLALRRQQETTLAFSTLHHLFTLIAMRELDAARQLVASMKAARASDGPGDQARVIDNVGFDLASAILNLAASRKSRSQLERIARNITLLGGSNAQRDVFIRTLACMAHDEGNLGVRDQILALRRRLKRDDRFNRVIMSRAAGEPHAYLFVQQ
jgi:tetratricopeptide (TPR) repeat protein